MTSKRRNEDAMESGSSKRKPTLSDRSKCFFGLKCYRLKPEHFKECSHPHLECLKSPPSDASTTFKNQWKMVKDLNLLESFESDEVTEDRSIKDDPAKDESQSITKPLKVQEISCPICEFKCQDPSKVEEHVNRVHFELDEAVPNLKKMEAEKGSSTKHSKAQELFNCPLCEHKFQDPSNLEEHINRVHFEPNESTTERPTTSTSNEIDYKKNTSINPLTFKKHFLRVLIRVGGCNKL